MKSIKMTCNLCKEIFEIDGEGIEDRVRMRGCGCPVCYDDLNEGQREVVITKGKCGTLYDYRKRKGRKEIEIKL